MADYTQFNLRGDTKSNWLNANPVLSDREIALETDTQRFKIGNGTSYYSQLPYGRNTGEYLNFYNVTALAPLTVGNYYTHETAILAVPSSERAKGIIVSYETASGVWYTERFIGSDVANWSVLANWEKVTDAGDIAQLRSDLSGLDADTVQLRSDLNELEQEQIQGGVYDVSSHNDGAVFESLSALLGSANLSTLIPTSVRRGGMTIRFIQNSDNKYVQYRLMAQTFSTTESDWAIYGDDVLVENSEFIRVYTDKDNKILLAIKTDGTIYFGAGVPPQVVDYIQQNLDKKMDGEYVENPEYIKVLLDADERLIQGFRADGTKFVNTPIEVQGVRYETKSNQEFVHVVLDCYDRVLYGIRANGDVFFGYGVPSQIVNYVRKKIDEVKEEIPDLNNKSFNVVKTGVVGGNGSASYFKVFGKEVTIKVELLTYGGTSDYYVGYYYDSTHTRELENHVDRSVSEYIIPVDSQGIYIINNTSHLGTYRISVLESSQIITMDSVVPFPKEYKMAPVSMIESEIEPTIVFDSTTVQGQPIARIPGALIANDGSVLVHAEIRELAAELGKFDLYVKRYVDGVLTNTIPVYVHNDTYGKGSASAMVIDRTGIHGTAGKIWYFYNTFKEGDKYPWSQTDPSYIKLWYVTSTDNGVTWSEPVNMDSLIPVGSFGMEICPSTGIQTKDGTLYISFYSMNRNTGRCTVGLYYLSPASNYWGIVEISVPSQLGSNESTIYEDENGDVIINTRTDIKTPFYRLTYVYNKFTNTITKDKSLDEVFAALTNCEGHIEVVERNNKKYYLFSFPDAKRAGGRTPVCIWASWDALHWMRVYYLTRTSSEGYSEVAYYNEKLIAVYEETIGNETGIKMQELTSILDTIETKLDYDWYLTSADVIQQRTLL